MTPSALGIICCYSLLSLLESLIGRRAKLHELYDKIAHANGYECCDESGQLERVVDYKSAYARRASAVEVDGSHGSGVVGQEEVAVYGREHGDERHGWNTESDAAYSGTFKD